MSHRPGPSHLGHPAFHLGRVPAAARRRSDRLERLDRPVQNGQAEDRSESDVLQRFARYDMQLMTPPDPRWGIRTLICEGDGRPDSSPCPGILGTLFRRSQPELSAQLMQMWKEGGSDVSQGMRVPDLLIIDPTLPAKPLVLICSHVAESGAGPVATPNPAFG